MLKSKARYLLNKNKWRSVAFLSTTFHIFLLASVTKILCIVNSSMDSQMCICIFFSSVLFLLSSLFPSLSQIIYFLRGNTLLATLLSYSFCYCFSIIPELLFLSYFIDFFSVFIACCACFRPLSRNTGVVLCSVVPIKLYTDSGIFYLF